MKTFRFPQGSIMIWTLLMGISLAVVFFFFSQRLNVGVASQHKTMEYLNAQLLTESYAAYLEQLDLAGLTVLRGVDEGNFSFQGITGSLTNATEAITGMLDMGKEASFEVSGGNAQIEWNLCSADEEGVLEISVPTGLPENGKCLLPSLYDGLAQSSGTSFALKSLSEPLSYRITPLTGTELYDKEWKLHLEYPLSFRKKITIDRTFTP